MQPRAKNGKRYFFKQVKISKTVKQKAQSEVRISLLGWAEKTQWSRQGGAIIVNRNWGQEHGTLEAGHKVKAKKLEIRSKRGWTEYHSSSSEAWVQEDPLSPRRFGPKTAWWHVFPLFLQIIKAPSSYGESAEFLEVSDPNKLLLMKISMIMNDFIMEA